MKKIILLFLFGLIINYGYGQGQAQFKKLTVNDWIIYQGDTLNIFATNGDTLFLTRGSSLDTLVMGVSYWSGTGDDIQNNNTGDVTLNGQVFVPDIAASGAKYSGNVAGIGTDDRLFPKSIIDLYNEQQDSLSKVPSVFGTFKRDTTTGVITPVNTTDVVKIDSLRGTHPGIEINQVDSVLQDLSANTGTDYTVSTLYTAFKFTASVTTTYRAVGLWLKKSGTITNDAYYLQYHLYSDNAGQPGTKLNFAWENLPYGDLDTVYREEITQIGQSGGVTAGTAYWIIIQATALPTGGGSVSVNCKNTGTNTVATSTNGTVWTVGSNYTAAMKFYWANAAGIKVYARNYYALDLYSNTEYALYAESYGDMAIHALSHRQAGITSESYWSGGLLGKGKTYGVTGFATAGNGLYGYSYGGGNGVFGAVESSIYSGIKGTNTTGYAGAFYTNDEYAVYGTSTNKGAFIGITAASGYAAFRGTGTSNAIGGSFSAANNNALVANSTGNYSAYIHNSNASYAPLWLYSYPTSTDLQRAILITRVNGSGASAAGMGSSIDFMFENSTGGESVLHSRIGSFTQRTTAGSERGAITFYTKGDNNPPQLRMTIDSSGTLYGTSLNSRATNTFFGFEAGKNYVGTGNINIGYRAGYKETGSSRFYVACDSTSWANGMASGSKLLLYGDQSDASKANHFLNIFAKVAIGEAKAISAYSLEVVGDVNITGGLDLGGNLDDADTVKCTVLQADQIKDIQTLVACGYTIPIFVGSHSSPADATTYYFGPIPNTAPSTTAEERKIYIPKAGTITFCSISSNATTAGTDEAWPYYIRLNNSTDYGIDTVSVSANLRQWINTGLDIDVVAGDYIEIKSVTPTWATNPAGVSQGGYLYIEQ